MRENKKSDRKEKKKIYAVSFDRNTWKIRDKSEAAEKSIDFFIFAKRACSNHSRSKIIKLNLSQLVPGMVYTAAQIQRIWTFILFWYTSLDVCKKRKRRIGELPRFFSLVTQCMISRKEKKRRLHANFHIRWPNLGRHVIQLAKILFFNFHFKTVRNDIQTSWKASHCRI